MRRYVAVTGLILVTSGCPGQSSVLAEHRDEFEALRDEQDLLFVQLDEWSAEVMDWAAGTRHAACDLLEKNGPFSKYSSATDEQCGPGGIDPYPPPHWGTR